MSRGTLNSTIPYHPFNLISYFESSLNSAANSSWFHCGVLQWAPKVTLETFKGPPADPAKCEMWPLSGGVCVYRCGVVMIQLLLWIVEHVAVALIVLLLLGLQSCLSLFHTWNIRVLLDMQIVYVHQCIVETSTHVLTDIARCRLYVSLNWWLMNYCYHCLGKSCCWYYY